jgi:hypothetical protein
MAARKSTTNRHSRPTRSDFTPDFVGSPFRVAYSYAGRCHVVVEVATDDAVEVEGAQPAYELAAALNYEAAQTASEVVELALEARTVLLDEQADRDAEAELDRVDAELSARCACYATGTEQQACLDAGYPVCDREARRARWLARQKQMRETARQLGLLGTIAPPAPVIVLEPPHPSPEMPVATYAAAWNARTAALTSVADALRGNADLPYIAATAHVSLTRRIELRRGFHGCLAVQVDEDRQGYASEYLRTFGDEDEGRQWISDEAARQARAARVLTA